MKLKHLFTTTFPHHQAFESDLLVENLYMNVEILLMTHKFI